MQHKMNLHPQPFAMIKSGKKTIELRLYDEKRQRIQIGDTIVFTNTATGEMLDTTVLALHCFRSFEALYKALPLLQCGYTEEDVDRAHPSDMELYYSVQEQEKYGVVGIEISTKGESNGIRKMTEADREAVVEMMGVFYASPAVHTNGSEAIFQADVDACVSGSPYLEGYVIEKNGQLAGYTMLAKSYSTEFGRPCVWIEDLYIQDAYRGMGLGSTVLEFVFEQNKDAVIRLEAEEENSCAVHVYRKAGFGVLPYLEMIKL